MIKRKKAESRERADPRGTTKKSRLLSEWLIDFLSNKPACCFLLILCSDWIVDCDPVRRETEKCPSGETSSNKLFASVDAADVIGCTLYERPENLSSYNDK